MKKEKAKQNILSLCRDCFSTFNSKISYCENCKSLKIINHDEIERLNIAHVDCDAFYASIEKRDNPRLKNSEVIIGGGKRGVVSTACYLARVKGVRSAMPMYKALELCPKAIVIKPNINKYRDLIDRRANFPYKISDNCFVDKFRRCIGDKHNCQMCALEQCKGPPMVSGSYPFS